MPGALRRDVRLLGDLLGRILEEAGGPGLLEDVERLRRATIALRSAEGGRREARARVLELVAGFDLDRAELLARAFTVYFQLVNLAEEQHRVRTLRERRQNGGQVRESFAAAVQEVREATGEEGLAGLLDRLEVVPVLTAHPTEARRRAVVDALRRIATELSRLDAPRLPGDDGAAASRRLLEEITNLWRTAQLRRDRPSPLDEVRSVMAVFDATVFRLVPAAYRALEQALAGEASGTRPPPFRPYLRWGSWVGGDRDGNPSVTAETTRAAMAIQADHVLRGLEAVTRRVGHSLTVSVASTPPSPELLASLARDTAAFPGPAAAVAKRWPDELYLQKLLLAAERLAVTRASLLGQAGPEPDPRSTGGLGLRPPDPRSTGAPGPPDPRGYRDAGQFLDELRLVQASLAASGATRLAYGELQHLAWQAETFGFHLASLEVRQHAAVHAQALAELVPQAVGDAAALDRLALDGWRPGSSPPVPGAATEELLATLRVMGELQARYGPDACRRYVVSFSRSAADLAAVRALARLAVPDGSLDLDVVPLFESRADLERACEVLDQYLALPGAAAWLERRGRRLEVMLGYSDSAKDAGFLAANLALYQAQGGLAAWAAGRGIDLVLFHGRGGALGRGGGPAGRAVRGQAPGSVAGRFKVTEQGEVIYARYGNLAIGHRHLEQVTNAVLGASTPGAQEALLAAQAKYLSTASRMAAAAETAWRALVERDGFAEFFANVTPIQELGLLQIGSRPARRGGAGASGAGGVDLVDLRAIPWVFAWSQNRCNLPGWYGLGAGLEVVAHRPDGLATLRQMYAGWPFFRSIIENAEMSLAKADPLVAESYLDLGGRPDLVAAIREEFRRTRALVVSTTGAGRLLGHRPVLRQAVDLRNPYVDALSFLQVRFLTDLRNGLSGAEAARAARLVLLTVNGVAAGLQNTG